MINDGDGIIIAPWPIGHRNKGSFKITVMNTHQQQKSMVEDIDF